MEYIKQLEEQDDLVLLVTYVKEHYTDTHTAQGAGPWDDPPPCGP